MVWRRKKVWFRRGISVLLGTGLILYGYGGSSCLAARSIDELWEVDEGSGEVELPEPGAYFGVETTFDDLGDMKCLSCILSDAMPDAGEKYAELLTEKPYEFELINTAEKSDGDKEVKLFYLNYTGSEEIEPLAWDADDVGIHLSIRQTISRDETEVRVLYPSEGVTPVGGEESNETDEETSSASELVKLPDPGAYFGVETEVYENQKNGLSSISFRLPGDYPNTGIDFAGLMEEEPFEFKLVGVDSMTEGDELTKFFQLAYTGSDKEFRVAKYISETNDGEKYHVQISQTTGTGDETILFMDYPTIGTELMEVELWDGAEDYTGDAEEVSDNEDWYYIEEEAENSESDTKAKSYKEIRDRYRPGGEKTDTSSETTSPETPKYAGVKSYAEIRDKMRAQLAEREKNSSSSKADGPTVPDFQAFCNNCLEEHSVTEESDYTKYVYFWNRNGKTVDEYLELLQDEYQFKLRDTHSDRYTFDYVGSGSTETFEVEKSKLDGKNVSLYIWAPEYEFHIWFADGIEYTDTGDRTTRDLPSYGNKKTASTSSDSSSIDWNRDDGNDNNRKITCTKCHGAREIDCTACGGDGGKYVYDNSTPNYSGSIFGSRNGKTWENCYKCGGSKKETCPRCGGSGEQ